MPNINPRLALLSLSMTLLLGGCEALAPESIKRTPVPSNLKIEPINREALSDRPIQSEPLKAREHKQPEYFPAKNSLLGNGNNKLGKASPEVVAVRKEGKYTLNFDDADLNEVAKTILDETLKINYIISPKVSGRVTLQTTRALGSAIGMAATGLLIAKISISGGLRISLAIALGLSILTAWMVMQVQMRNVTTR